VIEILIAALFPLTLGGLTYAAAVSRHRELRRSWRRTAGRVGLADVVEGSSLWFGGLAGMAGALRVDFDSYQRGKEEQYESGTRIVIHGDSGLTLRREVVQSGFERMMGIREIELGDAAFDAEAWVLGTPEFARAVLDAGTRNELRTLLGGAIRVAGLPITLPAVVTVVDGDLKAEIPARDGGNRPEVLAGALRTLLEIARKLQRPADIPGRLAENMRSEPEWEVRLQNLRLLAEAFPRHPRTREVLKRGCEDEREEVQLAAGLALGGEEGRRTLMEIATREWSSDACAARAVGGLGDALPPARAQAILSHALRTRRTRTAQACLDALGLAGGPGVVELLAKVLAIENGDLGIAAARALGASRAEEAEVPLLRALVRAPGQVREAAAEALGRAGSARAVLPLKEVAASSAASAALRRAARQAVAEIQSRLQGASPGQLSLAEGDAGQLSLADRDQRGRVSIPSPRDDA
jgi:HEAT repeat protein